MNEVKRVIGVLCTHLNNLFNLDLKPEYFRLAKFNKIEENVVETLWKLLGKFTTETSLSNVNSVKCYLRSLAYNSLQFFTLPDDMSYGSRELLLTLGFVIAKGELNRIVFDKIKESPFHYDYKLSCVAEYDSKQHIFNENLCKSIKDCVNLSKWMEGKIEYHQKLIAEYKLSVDKIVNKINTIMGENYTKTEIMAIHNEELGEKFLRTSEQVTTILENHEKWLQKENIFWTWMESVCKEREKDIKEVNFDNLEQFQNYLEFQKIHS